MVYTIIIYLKKMLSSVTSKLMLQQNVFRSALLFSTVRNFSAYRGDNRTFKQSTISAPKAEELKFSAFLRSEKTYTIPSPKSPAVEATKFTPKPEYTQMKFDPNIR
jgi:hypothetical protein